MNAKPTTRKQSRKAATPFFAEGATVKLQGDIWCRPQGREAYIYVHAGSIGRIASGLEFGNYVVSFEHAALHVHASRLQAVEEYPADEREREHLLSPEYGSDEDREMERFY